MNQNEDWHSTEPTTWKPEQEGEVLQGILYKKVSKVNDRSAYYFIQDSNQQLHRVWGCATIDSGMELVEERQEVRITYNGTKELKGRQHPLKLFDVKYRDNPNSETQVEEDKMGEGNTPSSA